LKTGKLEDDAVVGSLKYMQFPKSIGNENSKEEECAGYSDESKEEIECLFKGRYVRGSDRSEIYQNTETQSEE
jgi:hypothetical protein